MALEDKVQSPPLSPKQFPSFSPKDEKKAQKKLDRLRKNKKRGFEGKTLWDWLQLLGIPLLLACATLGFSFVQFHLADLQHQHDQNIADQQHKSDQIIANQQHASDQQRALDLQRATTLQTYIDNIQDLLLNHSLLKSKSSDAVATLARARTLTAVQGLDPDRKGRLVQFLYEAQLIGFAEYYSDSSEQNRTLKQLHDPIIDLTQADLTQANLSDTFLNGADLSYANLSAVNLSGTDFNNVNLSYTILTSANLSGAYLVDTDLSGARLSSTNLTKTDLSGADFSDATFLTQQQLDQVHSCQYATLPPGLTCHKKNMNG